MNKLIMAMCVVCLTGCAQQKVWDKYGASSQQFNMDMGQCQAQAWGISNPTLLQVSIVQNQCMFGKGWNLIDQR